MASESPPVLDGGGSGSCAGGGAPDRKKRLKAAFLNAAMPLLSANPVLVIFLFLLLGACLSSVASSVGGAWADGGGGGAGSVGEAGRRTTAARRERVRAMFVHAWTGYKTHAWGHDELTPVSKGFNDRWGGWGITIVDSLDTLAILGLHDELRLAREHVKGIDWESAEAGPLSVFEVAIRHLGGLLGAYTLTKDSVYLTKAQELADRLLPAFDTPSGMSAAEFDMFTNLAPANKRHPCLAEVGSLQLEFSYLSILTKNPRYAAEANRFYEFLQDAKERDDVSSPVKGMWPLHFDPVEGTFADDVVSVGGQGDSFYEYLLKLYLLDGQREPWLRRLYDDAVEGMKAHLMHLTQDGKLYVSPYDKGVAHTMDHLSCFLPGLLALGARKGTTDMKLAERLAETCYAMYTATHTSIGAEVVGFAGGSERLAGHDFTTLDARYQLRPETLESLFVLYRLTKKVKYREWAWEIFLAIELNCKTDAGYSGLTDVDLPQGGEKDDRMESFFLAETVKYLYLIFSDDDSLIDLNEYVLSTEAHPFRKSPP